MLALTPDSACPFCCCFILIDQLFSWSFVTWLSIILSNASMLIWVAGYSFAMSVDFYREASSLFSAVDFWANVALTVTLALGKLETSCIWVKF